MKNSYIVGLAALFAFALVVVNCANGGGGSGGGGGSYTEPDGAVTFGFDAATGALKLEGIISLSKSKNDTKEIRAVQGFDTYLWILDDVETRGTTSVITLSARGMEKGRHRLVLIITKGGAPYSSEPVTITVTE
jgi:hypothetical protein